MNYPFQVGDRIHELRYLPTYSHSLEEACKQFVQWEIDTSKPDATVTALTEKGFTYTYDRPVPIGRAQWGTYAEGGECFEGGFQFWRKIE